MWQPVNVFFFVIGSLEFQVGSSEWRVSSEVGPSGEGGNMAIQTLYGRYLVYSVFM